MCRYDFDTPIDRRNTGSLKWDKYKGRDIDPLWVADMDFRSPPPVLTALHQRIDHGVFGYTLPPEALIETVCERLKTRYDWMVRPDWIIWLPGLVTGLNLSCRAVGEKGDAVVTMVPIYPPFLSSPELSGRRRIDVPMQYKNGRWQIDFDGLAAALTPAVKLLLLCNPHNPTGRVFDRAELGRLCDFCLKNGIIICSDEIHCDLILDGDKRHIPTAALSPDISKQVITLMAPSKTYNIPGLGVSFAIIADLHLRKTFRNVMQGIVPMVNTLGYTSALAAYRDSEPWLNALIEYLRGNRELVATRINGIPGLSTTHIEATYLAWIDCRQTGLADPGAFFENAGVGLSDGIEFGASGFLRLNFACSRGKLEKSLEKMKQAMAHIPIAND